MGRTRTSGGDGGSPGSSAGGRAARGVFGRVASGLFRGGRGGRGGTGSPPTPPGGRGNSPGRGNDPGRGGQNGPRDQRSEEQRSRPADRRQQTRDPIDIVTGEVTLAQTDADLPGILPLRLERMHVSTYRDGRLFGSSWASTLDQRLELDADGVHFLGADGIILTYSHVLVPNVAFLPRKGPRWPLTLTGDGGYLLHDPESGRDRHFPAPGEEHGWSSLPLLAVTDRNGNRVDFVREEGVLVEVRHSGGYRIAVDTAPLGAGPDDRRVTGLRLVAGAGEGAGTDEISLVRFGYNAAGDLSEVYNSSGKPLELFYDDESRLLRWRDRNGFWYRYEYDAHGRAVRGIGRNDHLNTTLVFDADARATHVTDSLGATTVYRYNERLQVVGVTTPNGATILSEWDEHDRLLTRTDPLGNVTRYTYDEDGRQTGVVHADGLWSTVAYNGLGLPVVITDADGAVWRRAYDAAGNLVSRTDPMGAVHRYTYDDGGRIATVTDPLGNVTRIRTNPAGLMLATTDPLGGTTHVVYDLAGRQTEVTDAVGSGTRYGWTVEGRLAWRAAPDRTGRRWVYDDEGNPVEHVDELGRVTRFEYGGFDEPTARVDPDGTRLEFAYDTELRLVRVTDQSGLAWHYRYSAAGELIEERDFDGRALAYAYDPAGRMVERTNGLGQTTVFVRDAFGNIVARRTEAGETTFAYDAMNRMTRATTGHADVHFERDALGRVVAESRDGNRVLTAYDVLGRTVRRRTPSGAESHWSYTASGHPERLDAAGHTLLFQYDAAGRELHRRVDDGAIIARQWDPAHRLGSQTVWGAAPAPGGEARLLQHRAYRYREDGNVLAVSDGLTGDRRFDLDTAGRVTAVHARTWTERYAYDAAGNIAHAAHPAAADHDGDREYAGLRLRRAGRVRYEYDAQGRVVLRQHARLSSGPASWRYHWDAEDRLVGVDTPDGAHWRYWYDPFGRRIAKQRLSADRRHVVEQVDFVWDAQTMVEQTHRAGEPGAVHTTTWDYEPGTFTPLTQTARTWTRDQEWVDRDFYAIVTDLVGTPAELVDGEGSLHSLGARTLWGVTSPSGSPGVSCPLGFPGQYHDPETGLNYNLDRYYCPNDGMYYGPDALALAGGTRPHGYVVNPLSWIDPMGLCPEDPGRGDAGHGYAREVVPGGRPDGQKVYAGHGELRPGAGEVVVPPGTRVAVYADHGQRISDRLGHGVEMGRAPKPVHVYEPGDAMPNYTLKAPDGLRIAENSRTVEDPTNLSDLLRRKMGTVHWAACQEFRK